MSLRASAGLLLCSGCLSFGGGGLTQDEPPSELQKVATYDVRAERTQGNCAEALLNHPVVWDFDIQLLEDAAQTEIYWGNTNAATQGDLRGDGEFRFAASAVHDLRSPDTDDDWLPPCSVERIDTVEATFVDPEARDRFKGTMRFHFVPTAGSDCSDLIQISPPIVLPCDAEYSLDALATGDVRPLQTDGGAGGQGGHGGQGGGQGGQDGEN